MERGEVRKVGASLIRSAPLSTEHPLYKVVSQHISEDLKAVSRRVDEKLRTTKKMLTMVALDVVEGSILKHMFPEFNCIDYGSKKPGHSLYHAMRDLSNEWCFLQVKKYASSVTHFGGTAGIHLQSGRQDVHVVGDCKDEVYAHALHEAVLDASKLTRDVASASRLLGRVVAPVGLVRFLRGDILLPCPLASSCFHFCDALVVDGSMLAMSPHQVAASMLQLKSSVAYGFFPYCPTMLVSDEGALDMSGITFQRVGNSDDAVIEFKYPQGRCGVASYPVAVWANWVREQVITLDGTSRGKHFQLELLGNRGPFMYYRMVNLDVAPPKAQLVHALDLPQNAGIYTVMSWRLKNVGCNPSSEDSWEKFSFTAERRLIDQVYTFGMQLEAKSFTRFAIRKQLKVVNDRVVVAGSAVTLHAPLSPDEIDQLSVALFSKLFVDRYDAGNLSKELLSRLRSYAEFHNAGFFKKLSFIASLSLNNLWDTTLLDMDDRIRNMCDAFHRFVNGSSSGKDISIHRPPVYVLMSSVAKTWFQNVKFDTYLRPSYPNSYLVDSVPGLFCDVRRARPTDLPGKPIVYSDSIDVPGKLIVAVDEDRVHSIDFDSREIDSIKKETTSLVASLNVMDFEPIDRHVDMSTTVKRVEPEFPSKPDFDVSPDPIHTFDTVYENCFPGNAQANSQGDVASNVFDPQDRYLSASYLALGYENIAPKPQRVYRSKIKALNVTKRQDTITELLSAATARNTNPPVVSRPQAYETLIPEVWKTFKKKACVPNVDELLAKFRSDPVAMGEQAFQDWMNQAKDASVAERVRAEMAKHAKALDEYNVNDYMIMIKSDVKVPLSTKIQHERIEPQVIVYHDKVLSACYSTIFRVMVTRFLALLRPNVHVNLRKDTKDIAGFINALHPFDLVDTGQPLTYLENDFSKYDKSQLELAFTLEKYIFEQLGMNELFIESWFLGHIDCRLRSLVHSFTLHVSWQRKSGDATTAFGNVLLNCMSVLYAYPVGDIFWMVFMGDDSIICAQRASGYNDAVKVLAEVFNLQAKTYITSAPYFASNFIVISQMARTVGLLPDPIKRLERWSMSVGELDANFDDKFQSAADVCILYRYKLYTDILKYMVPERYTISIGDTEAISSGIATCISDKSVFTSIWEKTITIINN